jgi:hypothetical protein
MAITSLSLPFASQVHWITRALWVVSMLSAFLSVLLVCKQQRFIGRVIIDEQKYKNNSKYERKFKEKMGECADKVRIPRLSVVFLLCVSKTFLDYAIGAYVLGLGVYLGFVWHNSLDVDTGRYDSRNIFIVFLIYTCFCIFILFLVGAPYQWEECRKEFDKIKNPGSEAKEVGQVSEDACCNKGNEVGSEVLSCEV